MFQYQGFIDEALTIEDIIFDIDKCMALSDEEHESLINRLMELDALLYPNTWDLLE